MTDRETYDALPQAQRDALGFARWREGQRIGTHGPNCYTYGRGHYECALDQIERLRALLAATAAVGATISCEGHLDALEKTFSDEEIDKMLDVSEPLQESGKTASAVYRTAWDAATCKTL